MKIYALSALILLVAFSGMASAEDMVLDLPGAINYAIAHNRSLQIAGYDEQSAQYKVDEANAGFLPKLSFKGSYSQFGNIPVSMVQFDPSTAPFALQTQPDKVASLGLSLAQPIYTGGLIMNSYRLSRLGRDIAHDKVSSTREDLVRQVKEAFYGILLARELIDVTQESIDVAQAHLKVAQARYEVGLASRYDVLRGEVQVANLQPVLINMRNTLDTSREALGLLLGLDAGQTVDANGELTLEPFNIALEDCLDKALANRPELAMLRRNEEITERSIAIARASLYPKLYLAGGYTHQLNDYSLGVSLSPAEWSDIWSGTLSLSWDLFDGWAASSRIKQAEVSRDQARSSREQLEHAVRFEVENSWRTLKAAEESVKSQEKNVENAREGMRIAEARYREGLMQSVDVMDAELALNSAQTNYYQSIYSYQVALARLLKAMGEE
jgi:outer membrane protein